MATIEVINDSNFDQKTAQGKGKVMVEFFATWCPHCQHMAPIVDELASKEAGITFYRVDIDQSPDLANEYAPNGFPTFVLFEGGKAVATTTGEQSEEALAGFLSEN